MMRVVPESIDLIREECYRPCALLLSAIGLWPFGNKGVIRVKNVIISHVLVLNIVSQIFALKSKAYTFGWLLKDGPMILTVSAVALKYFAFCLIRRQVKLILEASACDWRRSKNEEELEIIKKCAMRGKFQAILFSIYMDVLIVSVLLVVICPACCCFVLPPLASVFLDLIMPLNESRYFQLPPMHIATFNQDRYYSLNVVWCIMAVSLSGIVLLATESLLLMLVQHVCGLLAVTSHRFEKAISDANLKHEKSGELIFREVREAVHMHVRAISFFENVFNSLGWSYSILICIGVPAFSINLYRLARAILLFDDVIEFLTTAAFALAMWEYIFFLNYIIQEVIDQGAGIFTAVCSTKWYKAPLSIQNLLLFVLLRSRKPLNPDLVGVFYPSMEGFSSITQMSLSYFMVLFSTQ